MIALEIEACLEFGFETLGTFRLYDGESLSSLSISLS